MAGKHFDNVIRRLVSRVRRLTPSPGPDIAQGDDRFDAFVRSLTAPRSRRGAMRFVSGLAVAGLIGWEPAEIVEAHNFLKKCQKITNKARRKRCIKRAKAHNAAHRRTKRKPNASCVVLPNQAFFSSAIHRAAQTFTEPNGGKLTSAQVALSAPAAVTGTYLLEVNTVDLNTGLPTNDNIASAQVPSSQVGISLGFVTFTFGTPATLVAGRQYALVLSRPGGSGGNHNIHLQSPGTCPGGDAFLSTTATGPFQSFNPPADLPYVTLVSI